MNVRQYASCSCDQLNVFHVARQTTSRCAINVLRTISRLSTRYQTLAAKQDMRVPCRDSGTLIISLCYMFNFFLRNMIGNLCSKILCLKQGWHKVCSNFNLLEPEFYIQILAQSVDKMRIIQEPNKVAL